MINKVVYIGYQPLTEKVKEDFYFKNLKEKGIKIEYWDLSEVYFKDLFNDQLEDDFIVKINSFSILEDLIKQQDKLNTLFLSNITFEYRVLTLYRLLSKYKCKTSFFARGALPFATSTSHVENFIFKLKKAFDLNLLFGYVKNKYAYFLKKKGIVKPYSLVFRAGEKGIQTIGVGSDIENEKSKIIDVNSFDYDKYVKTKNSKNLMVNKYCVFLDEYFPFHPDFEMLKIRTIEPNEYYDNLNRFFNLVENKLNVEVIIAAHPKADKYREKDFFNKRKVFFNKSAELSRYSEFVIAHCSSSISFAVLNKKPILTLTSNSIKEVMPNYYNFINHFSKILDTHLINIDDNVSSEIVLREPNTIKYSEYAYKYLTSLKSQDMISSEVFTQSILSL
ncbi:hypothetical protein [Chryseobacterium taiwanense]|uniref:Uncharacterized protein n=1 Tax=Chryseobacterium taiwanense TaxID=363331 RepID=A0A0B4CQA2_9FLAO|nr:hypothetical protein [Chryseobacterium taiwanense]KIC63419.1 hypothetical protein RM51_06995 [Chryseobacterium taiwanense]